MAETWILSGFLHGKPVGSGCLAQRIWVAEAMTQLLQCGAVDKRQNADSLFQFEVFSKDMLGTVAHRKLSVETTACLRLSSKQRESFARARSLRDRDTFGIL